MQFYVISIKQSILFYTYHFWKRCFRFLQLSPNISHWIKLHFCFLSAVLSISCLFLLILLALFGFVYLWFCFPFFHLFCFFSAWVYEKLTKIFCFCLYWLFATSYQLFQIHLHLKLQICAYFFFVYSVFFNFFYWFSCFANMTVCHFLTVLSTLYVVYIKFLFYLLYIFFFITSLHLKNRFVSLLMHIFLRKKGNGGIIICWHLFIFFWGIIILKIRSPDAVGDCLGLSAWFAVFRHFSIFFNVFWSFFYGLRLGLTCVVDQFEFDFQHRTILVISAFTRRIRSKYFYFRSFSISAVICLGRTCW